MPGQKLLTRLLLPTDLYTLIITGEDIPKTLNMSSLAAQLQNIASIDASRLTSKTGAPSGKSYLFPPKTAASHDLDAIFSLAQSGYEELLELDPGFEEFEESLFSEHARRTDRTQLNVEENKELDIVLGRCLRRLGRWIGIMAGGKCIEWLVRRFRCVNFLVSENARAELKGSTR